MNIVDVTPDENYGYRAVATLLSQAEKSWSLVFQDLIW